MFSLTKLKEFATSATQTSKTINKTKDTETETRFKLQNTENITGICTVSSDLDSLATMRVCRVCLATNLKMYPISVHKLSDMFERVTGVEMNKDDELPQNICWECVARLSSANNFIEKALKTHQIMVKKSKSGRHITITDITSIDTERNQLQSTLGTKQYKANHSDFHIEETEEIDDIYGFKNEIIGETVKNTCCENIRETEYNEHKEEIGFGCTDEEQQIYVTEVDISIEKDPIKSEQIDTDEEKEATDNICVITSIEADISDVKYENEDTCISNEELVISIKEEDKSNDDTAVCNVDESSELYEEVTDQKKKRRTNHHSSPLRNQRSNALSHFKEPLVVLEDSMLSKNNTRDSCKQLTANASLTRENEYEYLLPIKERIVFVDKNKIIDHGNTSKTISTRTSNVDMNSCLRPNDAEHLKMLFICDICNKPYHYKSTLKRHIMKHTKLYNTYFNYKTLKKGNIRQRINCKKPKIVFNCSDCSYKAFRKSHLDRHIYSKHTKKTVFYCSYCNYKVSRKSNLDRHINLKHTKRTVFICSDCSYKTHRKGHLVRHINSQHTKSSAFNCSYCSYKTYIKTNLNTHINSQHTKRTVFNCSYCSYIAYRKSNLDEHINSQHTKSIVFICTYCGYKAYRKSHLDVHINSQHTRSTVFNCSDCSFQTYHKRALSRHVKAKHP